MLTQVSRQELGVVDGVADTGPAVGGTDGASELRTDYRRALALLGAGALGRARLSARSEGASPRMSSAFSPPGYPRPCACSRWRNAATAGAACSHGTSYTQYQS